MDTPRRWQVASLATAVASLGFGAAVLARPVVAVVPSIELDQVDHEAPAPPIQPDGSAGTVDDPVQPMIVLPRTLGSPTPASVADPSTSPVTVTTAGSLDSPAGDDEAPSGPASSGSSGAPDSVDSPASADSAS